MCESGEGAAVVGAVYDRPYSVDSRKNGRS